MDAQLRRSGREDAVAVKDLETQFAEVVERVSNLTAENRGLKRLVRKLEHELTEARREAKGMHLFHGKRMHIKEKIEKILSALETVGTSE